MLAASRFRLYPTPDQMHRLAVQFGHARWVWNDALALTQKTYRETGKGLGYHALATRLPTLKKQIEWLAEADSQVLQQALQNLARKQRKLARKQKGSRSRDKARRLVARCHERVKNARKDYLHKLSRKLVDKSQAIAVEDLNVKAMVKSPTLAKSISDAGWGMFANFLRYKAERAGKFFVRTARFFPSSKTCSACGHRRSEMPLSVRAWTCAACNTAHDRDENAATNIGQEADRMWRAGQITAPGTGAAAGGGSISRRKRLGASRARPREARSPRL